MGMRSLKRSIAHYRMEMAGVQHINKPRKATIKGRPVTLPSPFAASWRKYLDETTEEFKMYLGEQLKLNARRAVAVKK